MGHRNKRGFPAHCGGLFIDNVDLEWCFRAKSMGFRIYGSARGKMGHEIGDKLVRVPGFAREQIVHGPIRLYYIMQNRILLYWMPHVPRTWVAQNILRIPFKFAIFALFVPGRRANIGHMLRGIWHGLIGRSGPYKAF
jgi:rhamnosyltransferase